MDAPRKGAIPHRTYFAVTSLGFIVVLLTMTVMGYLARPTDDAVLMQLARLADGSTLYQTGFVVATLLPVFGLLLTAGVGLLVKPQYWGGDTRGIRIMGLIGSLFVLAYAPVSAFAAISQWTIFPRELEKNWQDAERWYMSLADSRPASFEMLGWGLFGIGAVLIGGRLLRERPPLNWASWSLVGCGLTGVAAWLLHVAGVDAATTFSLISIALTVPFALGIFLVTQQEVEEEDVDANITAASIADASVAAAPAADEDDLVRPDGDEA